jgi:hypothetical protein
MVMVRPEDAHNGRGRISVDASAFCGHGIGDVVSVIVPQGRRVGCSAKEEAIRSIDA